MIVLPSSEDSSTLCMVYATSDKVIGLIKIPFDGNPNKTIGQIAHPEKVLEATVQLILIDCKYGHLT